METKNQKQSGEGSSSTNIPSPKFFKIIVSPHECTLLMIPQDFGSSYCKNMQTPAYLEVPSGEVWKVEVVQSQGQIWLSQGWRDFSDYYGINCGHFVMFEYNGHSRFSVVICDMSATEIEYPYSVAAAHGTRRAPKRDGKEKILDTVGKLGQCSLGKANKRKRQEAKVENVSVDMLGKKSGKSFRNYEQQSMIASKNKKLKQQRREGKESGRMHKLQTVFGKIIDKERSIAYQRAKAFKSKSPFIVRFMQPSYVCCSPSASNLDVPLKFARKYFQENYGDLVLCVSGKGSWSVKYTLRSYYAKINAGWKAFVVDNELKVGDACVFEVINGTQFFVDVTIFRAPGVTPMNKIDGESNESCRVQEQQPKIVRDKNKVVMDKERSLAYQRAKAFKSKSPFVILFMHPSYIYCSRSASYLHVPLRFARKYFQKSCGDLVLHVSGKGSWSVKYTLGGSYSAKIKAGWNAFVVDNELKVGDACVFEAINGTQFFIEVTIFRALEVTLMNNIDGGVAAGVSACKDKIIETDKVVPNSLPKVDCTMDLKQQSGGLYGFSSIIKESNEGCRVQKQQPEIVHDKNKVVMDKERSLAYQRAKTFTSENPFFICFMQPSYVSPGCSLYITMAIAKNFFSTRRSDLVLQVSSKRSWVVKCILGKGNAKLSAGWNEFVVDNNLKVGDVCVFEQVSGSKLWFNVVVFPAV